MAAHRPLVCLFGCAGMPSTVPLSGMSRMTPDVAAILPLVGIGHKRFTYRFEGRDYRLTDISGELVTKLMA